MERMGRYGILMAALAWVACAPPVWMTGETWPEADQLFHREPRWIGGDGALTVNLGNERTLWLFGDSFIASTPELVRSQSRMVRNSVAIQTGKDPRTAFMQFYWGGDPGEPGSFFPDEDGHFYWPGHGVRLGDQVLLFWGRFRQGAPGTDEVEDETTLAVLAGPADAEPNEWTFQRVALPGDMHGVALGNAVLDDPDGHVYVYGRRGSRHSVFVARWNREHAAAGTMSSPEWWCGLPRGWCRDGQPITVLDPGAPEFSVHRDPALGGYVQVFSQGYGATTLAWRNAPRPQGPWGPPMECFDPPESHEPHAFVYAGKAHPHLLGADLVATYVPSRFEDAPPDVETRLYYPHFVRLHFRGHP